MRTKSFAIVLAIVPLFVILVYGLVSPESPQAGNVESSLPTSVTNTTVKSPALNNQSIESTKGQIAILPKLKRSISAEVREKFESTNNYRDFIQQSMSRPESGGRFYAMLAYVKCQQISRVSLPRESSDYSEVRKRALENIQAEMNRCAGVLDQFGQNSFQLTKQITSAPGADYLFTDGGRGLLYPGAKESIVDDFNNALAKGDPYLIAWLLEANVDKLVPSIIDTKGQVVGEAILFKVASSVGCEITGTCVNSMLTNSPCAISNRCEFTDYRQFVLASLSPSQLAEYETVRSALSEYIMLRGNERTK